MKVLYLIDTLEGYGAEKSLVNIALLLEYTKPVFVHIYRGEKYKPLLEKNGIKVYSLNVTAKYGYKIAVSKLIPIIKKEKPDILHSTLFNADAVARKIKKKIPSILLVGSLVNNSYAKQRYGKLSIISKIKLLTTQIRDRWSADKVDYFISNSNAILRSNKAALNIPPEKIKVIYRGRSFPQENPSPKSVAALRNSLNIQNKIVFLTVGRLEERKGQMDLIEAFSNFSCKYNDVILLIAGSGSYRKDLEIVIKKLGIQHQVLLLGYRDDISTLLALADYFVFPSLYEGLPGALIEAIISRKPCIVSNIEENKECFPQEGAVYFEPGNIMDLQKRIEDALHLPNWKEKTAASYVNAAKKFNVKNIGKQYDAFYRNILENKIC